MEFGSVWHRITLAILQFPSHHVGPLSTINNTTTNTMTISSRVQQQFFASNDPSSPNNLIRLPLTLLDQIDYWSMAPSLATSAIPTSPCTASKINPPKRRSNLWTTQEHDRFLRGLELFPQGPWRRIAAVVRTKTTRQTMTHAQKYRQKIERHQRLMNASASVASPACDTAVIAPPLEVAPAEPDVEEEFKISEVDPVLKALIDSLEPIDDPDAWVFQKDAIDWFDLLGW